MPWPNPFNSVTHIPFTLARPEEIRLTIYNLLGQEVAVLVEGSSGASTHEVLFDGGGLSSGVYVAVLRAGGATATRKLLLLK
jgi:hypothetical protein